jgi:hypothetical protein
MVKKTWRKSRAFICPHCEKDFDKERKLLSHIKDAHPTPVPKNVNKGP